MDGGESRRRDSLMGGASPFVIAWIGHLRDVVYSFGPLVYHAFRFYVIP